MEKNILGKLVRICILVVGIFSAVSCASTPKFSGNGDLCGMIVDENNVPIKDFVVMCVKANGTIGRAVTNEGGIFAIQDVSAGKYFISGEKVGYARITNEPYSFNSREKIFCCKVNSSRAAIEAAENQIKCGNLKNAIKLLNEIYYKKGSMDEVSVLVYLAFANIHDGNKKEAQKYIRELQKNPYAKESNLLKALEEQTDEM